eukprot:m.299275 g.299275  ORF g.299275 m.299275 type:complete len:187 (+) comp20108_c0_seq3:180-740(+)
METHDRAGTCPPCCYDGLQMDLCFLFTWFRLSSAFSSSSSSLDSPKALATGFRLAVVGRVFVCTNVKVAGRVCVEKPTKDDTGFGCWVAGGGGRDGFACVAVPPPPGSVFDFHAASLRLRASSLSADAVVRHVALPTTDVGGGGCCTAATAADGNTDVGGGGGATGGRCAVGRSDNRSTPAGRKAG